MVCTLCVNNGNSCSCCSCWSICWQKMGREKQSEKKTLQLPEMPEKNNAVVTLQKTGHEIVYTTLEELVVKKFYGENELRRMYLGF